VQLFASDVHGEALEFARAGRFPSGIAADLEPEHLTRYFSEDASGRLVARTALRDMITFARHDLLADPPFSRLHLVSCRNLMIYLKPQAQEQVMQLFHSALHTDGHLMLGSSETPATNTELFDALSKKSRIYRRRDALAPRWKSRSKRVEGSGRVRTAALGTQRPRIGDLAQRWIINEFAPPSVVVNRRLDSLYFCGDIGRYLTIAQGEPNLNLMDIVRDGLASRVRSAVKQALDSGHETEVERVRMRGDGGLATVRVRIKPLKGGTWSSEGLAMVCFDEPYAIAAAPAATGAHASVASMQDEALVHELESELKYTREDLQSTIEELETSNEELQISNETALSMNEELQSSNEELKTSKEELQSVNEELTTVNAQLQEKLLDLEQANNDLQNFLDSSDLAMLFLDRELRVRRYTREATALFKLLPADRGRHLSDIASSLADTDLSDTAREVLRTQAPDEATVLGRNGRWYARRVLAYRTRDERPGGVVVTYADVTRILVSERLARERLAELEAIYDQAPVGLSFFDPELRIQRVNAQFARFNGIAKEAQLGQRPGEFLPHPAGADMQTHLESVHASGMALTNVGIHGELARAQDVWRDWLASYYPVHAPDGTLLGVNAMVQEVTERKLTERYLSAARAVSVALMHASSERELIEHSLAAVATHFEARICEYWEPEADGERFQITHFHVPGASPERRERLEQAFDQLRLPADDALVGSAWSQARSRWIEDVTTQPGFVRSDEAQALGLASGFALPVGSDGAVYGVMCFFTGSRLSLSSALESSIEALGRDVGHTIQRFRDSRRLRDVDERKSRFLSELGHELRNPLSSIANATEVLAAGGISAYEQALPVLRTSVATTSRLLDDLLDLERIEHGKITLRRTRVNLAVPIRQAVWAVHEAIDNKHQQLSIQLPRAALAVNGDALRLEQAIVNLLQNAVKYTPGGGTIEIAAYPEGEQAVVRVSDSGIGIDPQALELIFEPFTQLPGELSSNDGLGVGLSLVKQLVVLHGGRVAAYSDGAGRGATFTLHLPGALRAAHDIPGDGQDAPDVAGRKTIGLRVLVVDDNTASAETLALILSDWGCEAHTAANGAQALALASRVVPDVLVLDLGLPDMDGFELACRLREAEAHAALTIALSGFGDEQARSHAAQAGFDHYMVKPARLEELRGMLAAVQTRRDDGGDRPPPV
jgi:two-component system CheB/CheR fusion protein